MGKGVAVGGLNSLVGVGVKIGERVTLGGFNSLSGVTLSEGGSPQATRKRNSRSMLAFQIDLKVNSAPGVEERIPPLI